MNINRINSSQISFFDFVPIVSSFKNLGEIFQKCAWKNQKNEKNNRLISATKPEKPIWKCVLFAVPIIGNLIALYCWISCRKKNQAEKEHSSLDIKDTFEKSPRNDNQKITEDQKNIVSAEGADKIVNKIIESNNENLIDVISCINLVIDKAKAKDRQFFESIVGKMIESKNENAISWIPFVINNADESLKKDRQFFESIVGKMIESKNEQAISRIHFVIDKADESLKKDRQFFESILGKVIESKNENVKFWINVVIDKADESLKSSLCEKYHKTF